MYAFLPFDIERMQIICHDGNDVYEDIYNYNDMIHKCDNKPLRILIHDQYFKGKGVDNIELVIRLPNKDIMHFDYRKDDKFENEIFYPSGIVIRHLEGGLKEFYNCVYADSKEGRYWSV